MGHSEMLLAVAGLSEQEVKKRAEKLASGDWSDFPPAERLALQLAHRLTKEPRSVADQDVRQLVETFGQHRALDLIWHVSWCNYMTRVADAFQLPLERENVFASPEKDKNDGKSKKADSPKQADGPAPALQRLDDPDVIKALTESIGEWPGTRSSLEKLAVTATSVVVAKPKGKATLGKRYTSHISTQMEVDGRVIRGGGLVTSIECRQEFQIMEVLYGKAKRESRVLEYTIVKSRAFPGPASTSPIPEDAVAILLLGEKGHIMKALPDSAENRRAVRKAFSKKAKTR
jgi:hypothetical protein